MNEKTAPHPLAAAKFPAHANVPWTFNQSESNPSLYQLLDASGCVIGFVFHGDRAATRAECEANVRLIAEAPELLKALKSFLRAPSLGSNRPGSLTIEVQDFNLSAARVAIAKVEGGAA